MERLTKLWNAFVAEVNNDEGRINDALSEIDYVLYAVEMTYKSDMKKLFELTLKDKYNLKTK